jgi:5'-nucleotidase
MAVDLSNTLVTGVSSRALFDLKEESIIFERDGLEAYKEFQIANEDQVLKPGPAFPLIRALLSLNEGQDQNQPRLVEAVIMSRNSSETSMRIFNSIEAHGLDITRAALTGGAPLTPYLGAFKVNLFLSKDPQEVENALNDGFPAAVLYDLPEDPLEELKEIRVAFDGDAVIFADDSERIYQEQGIQAFTQHELDKVDEPMQEGPFASFLKALATLQKDSNNKVPIRTALVTARSGPTHKRVINTLRAWNVEINEIFFMGGVAKTEILAAFKPQLFLDDYDGHCEKASKHVPTGRVPSKIR